MLWWVLLHINMNGPQLCMCSPILNHPPTILPNLYLWVIPKHQLLHPASCIILVLHIFQFSSVQFSRLFMSYSLQSHGLQHVRLPCPSPTPGACSDLCALSWWCHPTISSSVIPFSSHLQSFPASGSFPMSQFFASGGQSIGVSASASVLPMNIQNWFPWGLTGLISLQSKEHSRVFSKTTVQKHQFFGAQLSL